LSDKIVLGNVCVSLTDAMTAASALWCALNTVCFTFYFRPVLCLVQKLLINAQNSSMQPYS